VTPSEKRENPLSAIHDLIVQISLRERLAAEWATASQGKKFGLVFEDHLPELLPLYGAKPKRGDLFAGKRVARFANFEAVAMRKLQQIHAATVIEFCGCRLVTNSKPSKVTAKASTAYASMPSGGFALYGLMAMPPALKLSIATEGVPP
jgi:hypothetical protein